MDHQTAMKFKPPAFHAPTWYQYDCGPSEPYGPLAEALDCKMVIVGAGLAGLSTAASLVERGLTDIVVLEQGQPGEGASGRNGGFVFGGFSLAPEALSKQVGEPHSRDLHALTHQSVDRVRARCRNLQVPIHEHGVLLTDWFKQPDRLRKFADRLSEVSGLNLEYLDSDELKRHVTSTRYGGGLMETDAFHFNPLQYIQALCRWLDGQGVRIYGDSRVVSAERHQAAGHRWRLKTDRASVSAEQYVLASGGYGQDFMPEIQSRVQPIATYIAVTEPLGTALDQALPSQAAVYDNRFAFDYYRRVGGDRLLWGGRISILDRRPAQIERLMRKDLGRVFPSLIDCAFEFSWGGWMSYARHQMPILAEIEPGFWLAIAFGGHGMAPTTLAGEVLADALRGDETLLKSFSRWAPVWAGGRVGRLFVQAQYLRKQTSDRLRAAFSG